MKTEGEIGMRRIICFLFTLLVLFGCTACASGTETLYAEDVTEELMQAEQKAAWGLTFEVKDVTPTGLTIVCTQSGGEPTGELQTGSYYYIEKKENDRWVGMEYTEIEEEKVGWTAEAWIIAPDSTLEWEVDWSWLYGELPAGEYRIGKSVMDWRETGEYDEAGIYAEFRIE